MNDRQQDTAQERAPKRQSPLLLLLGLVVLLALAYYGYGKHQQNQFKVVIS